MKLYSASVMIVTFCYIAMLAVFIFIADLKGTDYLLNLVGHIRYGDKIGHFVLMGLLSFFVILAWGPRTFAINPLRGLTGSLVVFVFVALEEVSQLFIRGRTFDWSDLTVDLAGVLIFGQIAALIRRKFSGT